MDRIWRDDVLLEAWRRVKRNRGSAGVDSETLAERHDSVSGGGACCDLKSTW